MNKVILMGRLTKDPELRYTQTNNMAIASFSLAVDRKDKDKTTDFFNVTAFGKMAEFTEKYLKKGTKILLGGRVQNDTYTNKQGQKVTATKIVADEVEFAESKKDAAPQPKPADEFIPEEDFGEELPWEM